MQRLSLARALLVVFGCGAGVLPLAQAEPAAQTAPDLFAKGLAGVDRVAAELIEARQASGLIVYVARYGKPVYFKAFGHRDIERKLPMERDTIVRIYSMSKPITAVAAMIAVEQGKLKVNDPVAQYVPEFAELAPLSGKAPRAMLVKDLLRHTSGFTYGFGLGKVDQMYRRAQLLDSKISLTAMAERLAKIPLLFPPGQRWHYGVSSDVLGLVVERATKVPFAAFLRKHLFDPLGMTDTGFFVRKKEHARFASNYGRGMRLVDAATTSRFLKETPLHSGGGGLVSTTSDYAKFARMLLQGGRLGKVRVISPRTVNEITRNQLDNSLVPIRMGLITMEGLGFGYGMSVRLQAAGHEPPVTVGEYGWAGMASTTFTTMPKAGLTIITMTQRVPIDITIRNRVRAVVLDALPKMAAPAPK